LNCINKKDKLSSLVMTDITHVEMLQMIAAEFPTLANQIVNTIDSEFSAKINNFEQNITNTIYDYAEPVVIAILCLLVFQILISLALVIMVSVMCFRMKKKPQKNMVQNV
ncbi:Hypothetical protein PACV_11, partial [Pacmanvirus A23]|uniref:Hypothetical protein n=1 Tax=Pacmanvirus A23 TaxID=1932881 RepID=UPI000A096285